MYHYTYTITHINKHTTWHNTHEHAHTLAPTVTQTSTSMHKHTWLTLTCLLNIGTKENICILGRLTSFDYSSTAVGNNAQALLIHQGEREFLLEESSKESSARLFTDLPTDWMTDCTILTVVSASCLTRLIFLQGLWHADTYSPLCIRRGRGTYSCIRPSFLHFADYSGYGGFQCAEIE